MAIVVTSNKHGGLWLRYVLTEINFLHFCKGYEMTEIKSWRERNPKLHAVLEASVYGLTVWSLVSVIWVMNTYNVTLIT